MSKETLIIRDVINNTKDVYMSDSSLNILLDFERVLDSLDLYAYQNWQLGELIQGPINEKYFVTCKFMWPYAKMPDPRGAMRLKQYDCQINFQKTTLKYPREISSASDYEAGTKVAKMDSTKIWIIEIIMPKSLMNDIHQGSIDKDSELVDLDQLEAAYEAGVDDDENMQTDDDTSLATQDENATNDI
jgi:hypothetical protein